MSTTGSSTEPWDQLTPIEIDILHLVTLGWQDGAIHSQLGLNVGSLQFRCLPRIHMILGTQVSTRKVLAFRYLLCPYRTRPVYETPAQPAAIKLSRRRREVLDLLAAGLSGKEIASRLVISDDSVASHTKHLYRELGVNDAAAAVIAGYHLGFEMPSLTPSIPSHERLYRGDPAAFRLHVPSGFGQSELTAWYDARDSIDQLIAVLIARGCRDVHQVGLGLAWRGHDAELDSIRLRISAMMAELRLTNAHQLATVAILCDPFYDYLRQKGA